MGLYASRKPKEITVPAFKCTPQEVLFAIYYVRNIHQPDPSMTAFLLAYPEMRKHNERAKREKLKSVKRRTHVESLVGELMPYWIREAQLPSAEECYANFALIRDMALANGQLECARRAQNDISRISGHEDRGIRTIPPLEDDQQASAADQPLTDMHDDDLRRIVEGEWREADIASAPAIDGIASREGGAGPVGTVRALLGRLRAGGASPLDVRGVRGGSEEAVQTPDAPSATGGSEVNVRDRVDLLLGYGN